MKLIALAILACLLSGCGFGAMHAHEVLAYPDGHTLTSDYWIAAGHFLSDPELGNVKRNPDGSWSIEKFKGTTDNAGLQSVVTGIGDAILRLFVPKL